MSPVAINGVDKQGVAVNGVQVKQALSAANETVAKGVFDETTLSAVDADLATANIKATVTIFGKAGKAEVVDTTTATPIAAARMKTGDEGWANGVKYTGTGTKTLNPANEVVAAGYYAATTLSAVDAQLAVANIKQGVNIFGFVGTVVPGGVETIETVSSGNLALGATYTPSVAGIFYVRRDCYFEYYSDGDTTWYAHFDSAPDSVENGIGDGTRFRIKAPTTRNYRLLRQYMSSGTYEVKSNADLAALANYTPADTGFYHEAGENDGDIKIKINLPTDGWMITSGESHSIGDGTNLRVENLDAANARWYVLMRAVMT